MKKIGVGILSVCMLAGAATPAFAANEGIKNLPNQLFANIQTYADGQMPKKPDHAIDLNKKFLEITKVPGGIEIHVDEELSEQADSSKKAIKISKVPGGIQIHADKKISQQPNSNKKTVKITKAPGGIQIHADDTQMLNK